ncbi:YcjF family protein [Novipirellula caenicola]|uniref:G domain-containing protein n=1 Tax=Novipirellula caenicola TaxID=1536901 RepID=A0ABP9VIQ3_9BACT
MALARWNWRSGRPEDDADYEKQIQEIRDKTPVPTIWLFGKTGSGKSSVVRFLTGAEDATIGEGYRPETKTSRRFDFPDSLEPLLSFFDTRGLAEANYDPSDDIAAFADSTQLMIVTVRIGDHALHRVIEPLRRIRKASPHRPIMLVLTCLHEVIGGIDLSDGPDPFTDPAELDGDDQRPSVPDPLPDLIQEKVNQFAGLHDAVIPVDLTQLEDGFADPNFGGDRLKHAILEQLPHAYRQAILTLNDSKTDNASSRQRRARWQVLASSALAGTAGAVPVPWVDIPIVLGIQTHLAMKLAKIYDQEITPARWAVLSSAAGTRVAVRLGMRGILKFIPWVGIAAGAATSFAFTYALGMSWDWYFADLRQGHVPSSEQLKEIFAEELKRGHELWRAK